MAESPGTLELARIHLPRARQYASSRLGELDSVLPDFNEGFAFAQDRARATARLHRRDMPVINETDVGGIRRLMQDLGISTHDRMVVGHRLMPLQRQIYLDKSIDALAASGVQETIKFLQEVHLVVSSDLAVIDGHHRWLSALLLGPVRVRVLVVDHPHARLLPALRVLSDLEGHERNM
jgi:hypothetical protein